jgi:tetratricopeptide (TPR) repeat protein
MAVSAVPPRGKLEEYPLPAVLRGLLHERRDGCLTVARGALARRLYLCGGMIIYGSSNDRHDRLGEILVAQDKLSRADLKKYWEQSQAGNCLLGITLVVNGCITMSDLYQGVTAQVVTILDRLQKWRNGDFEFEEGREPAVGTVLLRIPLALYLRTDPEQKPAAPPAAAGDEEQVFEIHDETAGEEAIAAEEARETESIGEVSFMVQELCKRLGPDPFALLGVPPEAGLSVIQAAYHRIAKVLHPDRLPKGCTPDLVHEADDVYHEVTAALKAAEEQVHRKIAAVPITPPTTVTAALRGRPTQSDDGQSRRFFAQGRAWFSKRNYWQAADALRQAARLKPADAAYRQYLGLALMQTKRLHEAEEHLVEAARLEPNNPEHFVNLGRVYRAGRQYGKARESFERALRLDPRNEQARDELGDLPEERADRKAENGGLLKKLFGKG